MQIYRFGNKHFTDKRGQRFFDEWIPLEDAYFDAYDIRAKASFVFDSSKAF